MFYIFFSLLLHLLPLAEARTDSCVFHSRIPKTNGQHFDCLKFGTRWQVARCLLQLNSLEYTMRCASWTEDKRLYFDLSGNLNARDTDILPSLDYYDVDSKEWSHPKWRKADDNELSFTPRGLIVAAAEICVEDNICPPEFFGQVLACPHEDMREFVPCLKCLSESVEDKHIDKFESFIRGQFFGKAKYSLSKIGMDWSKYDAECHDALDIDKDGDDDYKKMKPRADADSEAPYKYTYTRSINYTISDAPTPDVTRPSSNPTQTPEDDDGEEDETGSVSTEVAAGTKTLKRKEAAPTTTSPTENVAGRQAVDYIQLLGVFSIVVVLFIF